MDKCNWFVHWASVAATSDLDLPTNIIGPDWVVANSIVRAAKDYVTDGTFTYDTMLGNVSKYKAGVIGKIMETYNFLFRHDWRSTPWTESYLTGQAKAWARAGWNWRIADVSSDYRLSTCVVRDDHATFAPLIARWFTDYDLSLSDIANFEYIQ